MKRSILVTSMILALAGAALAQGQGGAPGGGGGGRGGQGGGGGRGGQGGGGGRGGQGGGGGGAQGGGRGAPAAAPTGPIADLVNKFVDSIGKQDAAFLNGVLDMNALWLDEDGHMVPANAWVGKLVAGMPRKMAITGLRTSDITPDTAYAAFNYTLDEMATPRGGAAAVQNQMKGLASIVFKKVGNDWKVVLVHAPVTGVAITPH